MLRQVFASRLFSNHLLIACLGNLFRLGLPVLKTLTFLRDQMRSLKSRLIYLVNRVLLSTSWRAIALIHRTDLICGLLGLDMLPFWTFNSYLGNTTPLRRLRFIQLLLFSKQIVGQNSQGWDTLNAKTGVLDGLNLFRRVWALSFLVTFLHAKIKRLWSWHTLLAFDCVVETLCWALFAMQDPAFT